jgi:heme oxygenase
MHHENGPTGAADARHGALRGGLADALRERTRSLHRQAESSGIVRDILAGRASRHGYALLLRNLLPAYREMEHSLERLRRSPRIGAVAQPALYRSHALESDLAGLCGRRWRRTLPLLDAGDRYARAVAVAGQGHGLRLIAHAYVRYLGDLNGGRVVRQRLHRTLGLEAHHLAFYEFPAIADLDGFRTRYRDALDRAARDLPEIDSILDEAVAAFRLNMALSDAVQAAAAVTA